MCGEDCGRHCKAVFSKHGTTPCYLCLARVNNKEWEEETHRRECRERNREEYSRYSNTVQSL